LYDTIRLASPFLDEDIANKIEQECIRRQGVYVRTGEIFYQITTGSLEGTYDSRLAVKVERTNWSNVITDEGKKIPVKVNCKPYIILEGSVQKLMQGHNVIHRDLNFYDSCRFLVGMVEHITGCILPDVDGWKVLRADVAFAYDLGSFEACQEYFLALNSCTFPRRQVMRYGTTGLFSSGRTTTIKLYHKGIEFVKHDRARLKKFMSDEKVFKLQEIANRLVRVEVEIKKAKIVYDKGLNRVGDLNDSYFLDVHKTEVLRLIKEGDFDMKKVRTANNVQRRLYSLYGSALAGRLLGTWYVLTTQGEQHVKRIMSKPTYYRHLKLLRDAGCSWYGSDVMLKDFSLVPADFVPVPGDSRQVQSVA